jgi:hypothetical protein
MELVKSDITREYIVIGNGEKECGDTKYHMLSLEKAGLLAHYSNRVEPMSPPSARQLATTYAQGKYFAFFDNHCLLMPDYFARAKANFAHYADMDMLHSCYSYDLYGDTSYHYKLNLKADFWGRESQFANDEARPYRIAVAGHGGFLVRSEVFAEVGGYWGGFTGYGGEEPYFDLKMALLDKKNYIDPRLKHIHYVGTRGYTRHGSDDFTRNILMSANIIGGQSWMETVFEGLMKSTRPHISKVPLYDIMIEAYDRSRERAAWLATKRKRTLDEQLKKFVVDQVAF